MQETAVMDFPAAIRQAQPDDAGTLAQIAEQTFRETFAAQNSVVDMDSYCTKSFGTEIQRREILDANSTTFLAETDGQVVGYAQLLRNSTNSRVSGAHPCELKRIYVLGEWQGRGLAQQITHEVLATADRDGAGCIWLGVWEENPRAIAYYRKLGFTVVGEQFFQLGSEKQRDLIMVKPL